MKISNPYADMLYRIYITSRRILSWPMCDNSFAPIVYPVHPFVVQIMPGMNLRIEPVSDPHPMNPARVVIEAGDHTRIVHATYSWDILPVERMALGSGHIMAEYMDRIRGNWGFQDVRDQCKSLLKNVSAQLQEYRQQWIQQCKQAAREQEIPLLPRLQDFMRSLDLKRRLYDVSVLLALLNNRLLEKHIPALEHDIRRLASASYTQSLKGYRLAVQDMYDLLKCTSTLVAAELVCKHSSRTDIKFSVNLFYRSYRIRIMVGERYIATGGDILLTCNEPLSWQDYFSTHSLELACQHMFGDPISIFERRIEPLLEFVQHILYSEPIRLNYESYRLDTLDLAFGYQHTVHDARSIPRYSVPSVAT